MYKTEMWNGASPNCRDCFPRNPCDLSFICSIWQIPICLCFDRSFSQGVTGTEINSVLFKLTNLIVCLLWCLTPISMPIWSSILNYQMLYIILIVISSFSLLCLIEHPSFKSLLLWICLCLSNGIGDFSSFHYFTIRFSGFD
jgi:hypothetical protein